MMIKTKNYPQANIQEAEQICSKIQQEAAYQVQELFERANKEAERILGLAKAEAENKKQVLLKDLDKKLSREEEKMLSSLSLEKKKIALEEKSKFAQQVLDLIFRQAEELRRSRDYLTFLKKAILQGAAVIDTETIEVFCSSLDEKITNSDFIKEVTAFAANKFKKNFVFKCHYADFKDIGVIVQSPDGHLSYDNRFQSRLKRMYDQVYAKLLKESF